MIHLAAPPEFWGAWELFYDGITRATRNLLAAAARMNVKRFIFVSSEAALQDAQPLMDIDETAPYPREPNSYRGKAKQLAEREILGFRSDVHCVILRPPYIWGEGNKGIENMIAKIRSGRFRWINNGQATIETVHAENVVEAITLACTKGGHKQVYFVTDDDPGTVRDHFEPVLEARGIESPAKSVPNALARPLATICDFIWKRFELRDPRHYRNTTGILLPFRAGTGSRRSNATSATNRSSPARWACARYGNPQKQMKGRSRHDRRTPYPNP